VKVEELNVKEAASAWLYFYMQADVGISALSAVLVCGACPLPKCFTLLRRRLSKPATTLHRSAYWRMMLREGCADDRPGRIAATDRQIVNEGFTNSR
jgi:hypothetical protein